MTCCPTPVRLKHDLPCLVFLSCLVGSGLITSRPVLTQQILMLHFHISTVYISIVYRTPLCSHVDHCSAITSYGACMPVVSDSRWYRLHLRRAVDGHTANYSALSMIFVTLWGVNGDVMQQRCNVSVRSCFVYMFYQRIYLSIYTDMYMCVCVCMCESDVHPYTGWQVQMCIHSFASVTYISLHNMQTSCLV